MSSLRWICMCALVSSGLHSAEAWVFLADGRVGWADYTQDPVAVRFPDGHQVGVPKKDIRGHRTSEHMAAAVDAMLGEMSRGLRIAEHTKRFQVFKSAAAPRLLYQLQNGKPLFQLNALFALQYGWIPEAETTVMEVFKTGVADVRKVALSVLSQHLQPERMEALVQPLALDSDLDLAGLAFGLCADANVGHALAKRLLAERSAWRHLERGLAHYYAGDLSPNTRLLLKEGTSGEQRTALVSLIHQNDNRMEARRLVAARLSDVDAELRDLAAEYFAWHGKPGDLPKLEQVLKTERDPHVQAALRAASAAIQRRTQDEPVATTGSSGLPALAPVSETWPDRALAELYTQHLNALRASAARDVFEGAWRVYSTREVGEPQWCYGQRALDEAFEARCMARHGLQAAIFGIPWSSVHSQTERRDEIKGDVAHHFVSPVRDYFDPQRKSFGFLVGADMRVFGGSVHVGDDVAWMRPHVSVVAIADGVVRSVSCIHSWGFKVMIEHRLPDGSYVCSLYAHLSPFVHVQPGQKVRRGEKIGSVGRTNTWENGGYRAHLHFGIHAGRYLERPAPGSHIDIEHEGRSVRVSVIAGDDQSTTVRSDASGATWSFRNDAHWICGYIDPRRFAAGRHGWQDPQDFLKRDKE